MAEPPVIIKYYDPDATDSSSGEEDQGWTKHNNVFYKKIRTTDFEREKRLIFEEIYDECNFATGTDIQELLPGYVDPFYEAFLEHVATPDDKLLLLLPVTSDLSIPWTSLPLNLGYVSDYDSEDFEDLSDLDLNQEDLDWINNAVAI